MVGVGFGGLFIAFLFGALAAVAFVILVGVLVKNKEGGERGSPRNPLCVLHIHRQSTLEVWHRGQVFHDHDHRHGGEDSEDVVYTPTGDDDPDGFTPTPEAVEEACNDCSYDGRNNDHLGMRLATPAEAYESARLPLTDGKPKSFMPPQPQARNVEAHERVRNADPSVFPSEQLTIQADRADMAARGGREVCLADIEGEQLLPMPAGKSGKF